MSFRIAEILALTLACSLFAPAQQGKAESGFYTWNYHGDTWTGTISSFDQGNGALTLVYEHRGKVENFTGVIKPPVQVLDKNGNRVSDQVRVKVGNRITAYYIKEGLKYNMRQEDGKRHDCKCQFNLPDQAVGPTKTLAFSECFQHEPFINALRGGSHLRQERC